MTHRTKFAFQRLARLFSICEWQGITWFLSQKHAITSGDSHPPHIFPSGQLAHPRRLPTVHRIVPACLLVCVAAIGLAGEGRAQDHAGDKQVLVALYTTTDGPNWRNNQNWLSDEPLDDWYGVTVHNGRVTGLILIGNQLTGSIPPELGKLADLERLSLAGNQLTGTIPPELGKLANLEWLIFDLNQLTGTIPPELGKLANLKRLILINNQLTGTIPPELGKLANLEELYLYANQLTGTIPSELGKLANLQRLGLYINQLTGEIPSELGKLANLERLWLSSNQLTGTIPPELGKLANLKRLILPNNRLTGSIPSELGNLANLLELSLGNNQLTGPIPSDLGNLANLEQLSLWGNRLIGPIPSTLGKLASLQFLWLTENQLTGSIPSELGKLANLERLWLSTNHLTGPIPSTLGKLANLLDLFLAGNRLTGPIPSELGELANLQKLWFPNNRLTGSIPSELGNLTNLQDLTLHDNHLTGPIPSELGKLANLEHLNLSNNQLTGAIPSELGNATNLQVMYLHNNQLTGSLPLSFANLVEVEDFWFHLNPGGLCAEADAVIQKWLDGIKRVLGPNCSPSVTLSVTPPNLVEGSGATPVMLTANQTPVSRPTPVHLFVGGTAKVGENQDYTLNNFSGSFNLIFDVLIIPANSASGTTIMTFFPLADSLIEGRENIILQAARGEVGEAFQGLIFEGWAILTLKDQTPCAPRERAALEVLYHATGGTSWANRTNWLSTKPLSKWHGVTVNNNGCVTHLDLSDNRLTGHLPSQLGNLVNLEGLDLSSNQLTGIIPPSFTNLVALKRFWFDTNSGLCAQAATSIRTWLSGIADVQGPDCSSSGTASSIFVPVILSSAGQNQSFFTSELTLTNRGTEQATLHYTYTADQGGGSGTATDSLAPGSQRIEPDAIDYLTRLGIPVPGSGNRRGTLRVEGSGSSEVSVVTRTTTDVPEGRAGLAYPGIVENEGFQEAVYLCGLRQNTQDRSNVAFQNMGAPGDGPITLRTTLFSGEADDTSPHLVGEETLPPGGFHQYNEVLKELGSPVQGYVKVEKVAGRAPFYAYGVINDNFNSDGSFVFPVTESSLVGRFGQTLPVIIETGNFQSELTVTNFSQGAKTLAFRFVAEAVETYDDTAGFSMKLEVGEQRILPDLVSWLRQQEVDGIGPANRAFVGPLVATPAEGDMSGIVIGARTGAPDRRGGQYSLFYNAVPSGSASVESTWVYGLQQNAENRSNLALVNTGEIDESTSTFEITIYDGSGESQPRTKSVTLGPRRWHQENGILGKITQGYVQVRKTSGNNPFITYGVINDGGRPGERSGDGTFLLSHE